MGIKPPYFINLLICSLLLTTYVSFTMQSQTWEQSHYFNTSFLKNKKIVINALKKDGFKECNLQTDDGLSLACLFLEHPHAQYNLVVNAGWYGYSEKAAPFYAMLADQPCNLFFIGGRNSSSHYSRKKIIWEFGHREYYDTIAALNFLEKDNQKPIFLLGLCAGGYFQARALVELHKQHKLSPYIHGLIIDGGWYSPTKIASRAPLVNILEHMSQFFYNTRDYQQIQQQSSFFNLMSRLVTATYSVGYQILFKPELLIQEKTMNIMNSLPNIDVPCLFIHSYDDRQAPIKYIQELAKKIKNKKCWWITSASRHACNHLKYKQEYRKNLLDFIHEYI